MKAKDMSEDGGFASRGW